LAISEKLQSIETFTKQKPGSVKKYLCRGTKSDTEISMKSHETLPQGNLDSVKIEENHYFLAADVLLERLQDSNDFLSRSICAAWSSADYRKTMRHNCGRASDTIG
jgi:hypothetical protein